KVIPVDRRRAVLESVLPTRPGHLGLLMNLGRSQQEKDGRPETEKVVAERVRWYQAAVAAHPENSVARNNLGVTRDSKGELDGAITDLREAVRLAPNSTLARTNLGNARARKGELEGAIDEYRGAIHIDPNYAPPHVGLGFALAKQGNVEGGIAELRE